MTDVLEILVRAKSLILHPSNWTKRAFARCGTDGLQVSETSPKATCWCAMGAVRKAAHYMNDDGRRVVKANDAASLLLACQSDAPIDGDVWGAVIGFNDRSTHGQVLELFNKAIERASK